MDCSRKTIRNWLIPKTPSLTLEIKPNPRNKPYPPEIRREIITTPELIASDSKLTALFSSLEKISLYALDTEFVGEGSYTPKLALIQLAWQSRPQNGAQDLAQDQVQNQAQPQDQPSNVALIDPLHIDPSFLADFFSSSGIAVMHSAVQDLNILKNFCGNVPSKIFDTQIAAGFLGMGHPKLGNLVYSQTGKKLPKDARLSDWLKRPLTDSQLEYAKADVAYLIQVHNSLKTKLLERGRENWANEESEKIRLQSLSFSHSKEAWRSIKEIRKLKGRSLSLAKQLSNWREQKAQELDRPKRNLLSDWGVAMIAQSSPKTIEEMKNLRGLNPGFLRSPSHMQKVLQIIEAENKNHKRTNHKITLRGSSENNASTKNAPDSDKDTAANISSNNGKPSINELTSQQFSYETIRNRPTLNLLLAWLNAYALELEIHPPLLATRTDLLEFFSSPPQGKLINGWRGEILASSLEKIISGETAVALSLDGKLVLEERSRKPLEL